ncbi:polysaccharide pyruvyl transferase family protein [Stutzerimonas xanthomarina]|uniref:Polysaccharide pyruvyl transferase n=2 Tax=Stutzerimonas xanthomarina TaxID=271420 RepID=A0A1M5P831_9GAMM|nr:polysaccharide pyruvyl transferase family protein [Stutzerimonas xanthomarina]MCP9338558.1 polysaccharide pyruvyl transferase family protein [Stutzerimonas xanthomarina]SEH77318.1 Polysaccharide pyruvyl transferase [Stutzerimonas xanthomarina]SHG97579.1 Polysaccharide pyruvyl transferase [Stutzerimonas xanthomarina DSM 18231]
MKIAIMTQPLGKNYGGIMQAWALQQVLKRMGHEVVTIDRQPDQPGLAYKAARIAYRAGMKAIGKRKAPINFEKHLPTILQHTRRFIDQHLTMSEPLYSTQQLRDHFDRENYDAVIVGSDQTWRPQYSPNIYNFFLDFLEDKDILRIAYASSFGVDTWEYTRKQTERCAQLAKKFNIVSVREISGIHLCEEHFGVAASHALDPTLLLDKSDYEQLIDPQHLKENPYGIFTYFLDKTSEKTELAKKVSEEMDETLYECPTENFAESDLTNYKKPPVEDWLSGLYNAKFVLTDSFHGMVFAILFGKPFKVILNSSRGATRFTSLARMIAEEGESIHISTASIERHIPSPSGHSVNIQRAPSLQQFKNLHNTAKPSRFIAS